MKKILVIIGQHRSGTSMLSGSLELAGGWLGINYQFEADQYNQKGYFENKWTDEFNNRVLRRLHCDWHHVTHIPDNWLDHGFNDLYNELIEYIAYDLSHLPENKFYVIKDPRISLILPIYLKAFDSLNIDAKFIFSDRETEEIVNSIFHRDGLEKNMVRNAVINHRHYAKKHLKEGDYIWTNTFSNMFYRPDKFLKFIKEKFNIPMDVSPEALKNISQFVDVNLKNHNKGKNCKVIATYFGPRRTQISYHKESNVKGIIDKVSGEESSLRAIKELIENERKIDSGVFMDTIIVNHDISELVEIPKAKSYLEEIDGTPTLNGVIKIINRPWNKGIGGSFGSFDYAFQHFKNDYEYWFFTEDNVIQIENNYFKACIEQLKEDITIGFVCAYRYTTLAENKHEKSHCHGGCGATHIDKLNIINKELGHLPYFELPYTTQMTQYAKNESAFNFVSGQWYGKFEEIGEVNFTNAYIQAGYKLKDINFDLKLCRYYLDYY